MKPKTNAKTGQPELDDIHRKMISILAQDGRISLTALAEKTHISRAHCHTRLQYLQEAGIITGFTVEVDPLKMGFGASAHVILKLRQHNWRTLRESLLDIPEVWHVALTGGPMDVILLVRAKTMADLRRVIFEEIQSLPDVVDTQTYIIFDDEQAKSALG